MSWLLQVGIYVSASVFWFCVYVMVLLLNRRLFHQGN